MNTTKKLLTTLLLALMTANIALAYDYFEVDGIYYLSNGTEAIVSPRSLNAINPSYYYGDIVIPETVTYNGVTYTVTTIGDKAFYQCSNLTSIHLPKTIKRFEGQNCFAGCGNLSVVEIESLESWCSIDFEITGGYGYSHSNPLSYAHNLYINGEPLTELVIPDGVTRIGKSAFCRLSSLTRLEIPTSVTSIGDEAFAECGSIDRLDIPDLESWLKMDIQGKGSNPMSCSSKIYLDGIEMPRELVIPETTTKIPANVFNGCNAITSVSIPSCVETIGTNAFASCDSLKMVDIQDIAAWCNIVFENEGANPISNATEPYGWWGLKEFTLQVNGTPITELVIPEGVTSIGAYAFDGARLEHVTFPNTLVSIGNHAFPYNYFDEVILPESLKSLGECAFPECRYLERVQINDGLEVIPTCAFDECGNLSDVSMPSSVKKIELQAFYLCRNLTTMPMTDSLQTIGYSAFAGSGIETLKTGKSLTSIGEHAFSFCNNLKSVEISDPVTALGQLAFYLNDSLQIAVIGNGVHKIPKRLFSQCSNLTSVTLGNAVDTLEEYCFEYCEKIDTIVCMAAVPPVMNGAEDSFFSPVVFQNATLYVPMGSVEAYKTANVWKNFQNIVGVNQTTDQDYEYVPFVREGVKWTYSIQDYQYDDDFYTNPAQGNNVIYRTLELKGDTVINGKTYKAMHKYSGDSINWENDTIPVYLREENKIVYGIIPDGKKYDDCFVFNFLLDDALYISSYSREEFVLYDFNDPIGYWNSMEDRLEWIDDIELLSTDTILIGNHLAKRYTGKLWSEFQVIEGIGAYGFNHTPVCFFFPTTAGIHDAPIFNLEKVVENGEVIYPQNYVEDRYLPLIREGVKWVNEHVIISEGDTTRYYYTYEFKGSHPVHYQYNTLYYESMYYYEGYQHELDIENDSLVAGLSENEGCVHYSRNDPLSSCINQGQVMINYNGELLYPMFNNYLNAKNYYLDYQIEPFINDENFIEVEPVEIDGVRCSRYAYIGDDGEVKAYIIEGIGFDSRDMGDLLTPFTRKPDPDADYQEYWGLSHVIKDGKIIYKGMRYNPDLFDDPGDENGDDYEYVPFVREGVKWVYYYDNPFNVEVLGMADGIQYYSFELKGDTVIDGKSYKPVQLSYLTSTGEETTQDFVPAYLREEDKKVYAILPEGRWYPQCPVGLGLVVSSNPNYSVAADEFVLYDFNDPTSLYEEYEGFFPDYTYTDTIAVGTNHLCKRHHYVRDYGPQNEMLIIEGYGYVSGYGMPLYYFPTLITGMQVFYHLSHVIENGKIIYKGTHYIPGDVNGDGEVTIADANSVIDVVIMGGNAGHTRAPAADMNDDGEVTITDVNAIIEIIIKGN